MSEITVLWARVAEPWSDGAVATARHRLPAPVLAHMPNYRRWQDVQMGLGGKLLLLHGLIAAGHGAELLARMTWSDDGRPRLPVPGDFNISHSGGLVACAFSFGGRIGLDVEVIHRVPLDELKDALTDRERAAIRAAPDEVVEFCRVWTFKEAVIKADGRGVGIGLQRIDSQDAAIALDGATWHVQPIALHPAYAAHLATESPGPKVVCRELTADELLGPR